MRVRLLLPYLSHPADAVLDLPDDKARMLIQVGAAVKYNGEPDNGNPPPEPPEK